MRQSGAVEGELTWDVADSLGRLRGHVLASVPLGSLRST